MFNNVTGHEDARVLIGPSGFQRAGGAAVE